MSTSKYIRPMNFGELLRSTLIIYAKAFWPLWAIVILITVALDYVIAKGIFSYVNDNKSLFLLLSILLPVFFVGPAMLIISNLILERPKKAWASFSKGMSLGMILKTLLFFSPVVTIMLIVYFRGLLSGYYYITINLLFSVPLLFLLPIWVFYPMILLLEKKSVVESIRRTWFFIQGQGKRLWQIQLWLIMLTILIAPLGIYYYNFLYQIPFFEQFKELASIGFRYSETYQMDGYYFIGDNIISGALYYGMPLVLGLGITAYVLYYYQVRAAKENFNEELLTEELGDRLGGDSLSHIKYLRPMSFGELIRSSLIIYAKAFWPLWAIVIVLVYAADLAYLRFIRDTAGTARYIVLLIISLIPVFFIGPAMFTISDIILERPKKTWVSFKKGMSFNIVLKISWFFAPFLIFAIVAIIVDSLKIIPAEFHENYWSWWFAWLYLLFSIYLIFFTPAWVFHPMILLLEKKGVFESAHRKKALFSGQFRRSSQIQIVLIVLACLIAPLGISYYLSLYQSQSISQYFTNLASDGGFYYFSSLADVIGSGLYFIIPFVLGLHITTYIVYYYQVRAAKENFNEELLTQELGYQPVEEMMTV